MWGVAQIGEAASGLQKILRLAETIEDGVERSYVLDAVEQIYVLYFSPHFSRAFLQRVASGDVVGIADRLEMRTRLGHTEGPVRRVLEEMQDLIARHGRTLTIAEREALKHIAFGKLSIRRALQELLRGSEREVTPEQQILASKLLGEIEQLNMLMERTSTSIKATVNATPHVQAKGLRLSYWAVLSLFLLLFAGVTVAVIFGAEPIRSLIGKFFERS